MILNKSRISFSVDRENNTFSTEGQVTGKKDKHTEIEMHGMMSHEMDSWK